MVRRVINLILISLIVLSFSYNTENLEISRVYFEKGIKALSIRDYEDAFVYFWKAHKLNPKSPHGEQAYLYYGYVYALISYNTGRKEGILSAIGFLNQYTGIYKEPKYLELQEELIGDSYFLLGWFDKAQNVYADLYGKYQKSKYVIKFSFVSALMGDIQGYRYLRTLREIPDNFADIYYLTFAIYLSDFGRYEEALEFFKLAYESNTNLKYDLYYNFYYGRTMFKLNKFWNSMLYLERAKTLDKFRMFSYLTNYYLINIYLTVGNYTDAFKVYKEIKGELFYNPFYQIVYLNLWLYKEFLEKFKEEFKSYYDVVLQLGWLKFGNPISDYSALALINKALEERNLTKDEREFLKHKKVKLKEFFLDSEVFSYGKIVKVLNLKLQTLNTYKEDDVDLIYEIYKLNKENFLRVFYEDKSIEKLARTLVYKGDREGFKIVKKLKNPYLKKFLRAKLLFVVGENEVSQRLLKESYKFLEDLDSLEAYFLLYYYEKNPYIYEISDLLEETNYGKNYFPYAYRLVGKILEKNKLYKEAEVYYRKFIENYDKKDTVYYLTLLKLGFLAEKNKDKETLNFVLSKAKEFKNVWSDAILTLWGG